VASEASVMMLSSLVDCTNILRCSTFHGALIYARICQNLDLVIFTQASRSERMVLIGS
jgi:hypothetical protein